jgi:hypothetical protein
MSPAAAVLRSFVFERLLFEECREEEHAVCMAGKAVSSDRRFLLCTCACHQG